MSSLPRRQIPIIYCLPRHRSPWDGSNSFGPSVWRDCCSTSFWTKNDPQFNSWQPQYFWHCLPSCKTKLSPLWALSCQTPNQHNPESTAALVFMLVSRFRHPPVEQQVRCRWGARLRRAGSQEILFLKQTHLWVIKQQPFALIFKEAVQSLLLCGLHLPTGSHQRLLSYSRLLFKSRFIIVAQAADGLSPFGSLCWSIVGCFLCMCAAAVAKVITRQTPLAPQESDPTLWQLLTSCFATNQTCTSPCIQAERYLSVIIVQCFVFHPCALFTFLLLLLLLLLCFFSVPQPELCFFQIWHADVGGVVATADGDAAVHDHGEQLIVLTLHRRGLGAPLLQRQGQRCLQRGVHFRQACIWVQSKREHKQSY